MYNKIEESFQMICGYDPQQNDYKKVTAKFCRLRRLFLFFAYLFEIIDTIFKMISVTLTIIDIIVIISFIVNSHIATPPY